MPVYATDPHVTDYSKSTLGLYDISTFDVYADRQTVHIIAGGKQTKGDRQLTVQYMQSKDGGRNWTNPITINEKKTAISAKRGNDIQLAASGSQLVALMQEKSELPGMGPIISLYSSDHGKTWQLGANPAHDDDGNQAHIELIADQRGVFHAVWLEDPEENGYQSIRYAQSIDGGKQWQQPKTLDDTTCSCCWNTMVLSSQGLLNVLYRDMVPRDMTLIQSADNGSSWQHVGTVGEFGWQLNGCPQTGGSLAYVRQNKVELLHSLVWTGMNEKAGLYYLVSSDNGRNWSAPKRLGVAAINGDLAGHDGRGVMAVWNEMEAVGMSVIYAETKDNGVTWSSPVRIAKADNAATQPRLVATTGSNALVLWTEKLAGWPGKSFYQRIIVNRQLNNIFEAGNTRQKYAANLLQAHFEPGLAPR
ncbi:sialidase family protein [Nitrosomonas aestuarii]|uniref:sialidase family protein n=1 Tax=Nitrosomonas aestuarii TaxID=52441 RepID=UPI0015E6E253|nr:sialidase family protein [Nitrosomonas aestuarii]